MKTNIVLIGGHDETFTHFDGLGFDFTVLQLPTAIGDNLRELTDDIRVVPDFEPNTVIDELARVRTSKRVDRIFSFTERGLLSAALASHHFAIPGLDLTTCELCIDKRSLRTFLDGTEFAVTSMLCRSWAEVETFFGNHPQGLVLKVPTGSGSEGVFVVRDEREMSTAMAQLGPGNFVMLAEEYLPGREVSVETLTIDGNHRVLAVTNKKLHRKTLAEEQHIISPDVVEAETLREITDYCERLLSHIGYRHGPCHIELKITDAGPRLIEINNRVGGDYIGLMVELTTGVSQIRETMRPWSSKTRSTDNEPTRARYSHAASHQFYQPTDQERLREVFAGVDIIRFHMGPAKLRHNGNRTNNDKIGWIVFAGNDSEAFKRAVDYLDVTCT